MAMPWHEPVRKVERRERQLFAMFLLSVAGFGFFAINIDRQQAQADQLAYEQCQSRALDNQRLNDVLNTLSDRVEARGDVEAAEVYRSFRFTVDECVKP